MRSLSGRTGKRGPIYICLLTSVGVLVYALWWRCYTGPLTIGLKSDPELSYYLNCVVLGDGHVPYFIDHPGTPVFLLVAPLLRICHLFFAGDNIDFTLYCIQNAEGLSAIAHGWLVLLLTLSLSWLLWDLHQFLGRPAALVGLGLLLASPSVLNRTAWLTSDIPLLSCALLAGVGWLRLSFGRTGMIFLLGMGMVAVTGVFCKATFLPIALGMTLAVFRQRYRRWFFIGFIGGLAFWSVWMIPHWKRAVLWFYLLITRQGAYGAGEQGLFNFNDLGLLAYALLTEPAFLLILMAALTLLFYQFRTKGLRFLKSAHGYALFSLLIAAGGQVGLVLKEPLSRYLVSSIALTPAFYALVSRDVTRLCTNSRWARGLVAGVLALIFLYSFREGRSSYLYFRDIAVTQRRAALVSEKWQSEGIPVLGAFVSSGAGVAYAVIGNYYTGKLMAPLLRELYPQAYNAEFRPVTHFGYSTNLPRLLEKHGRFVFQGSNFDRSSVEELLQRSGVVHFHLELRAVIGTESFWQVRNASAP